MTKQHGKIQIGDMSLDAEIDMEITQEVWEKPEDIEQIRQFFWC